MRLASRLRQRRVKQFHCLDPGATELGCHALIRFDLQTASRIDDYVNWTVPATAAPMPWRPKNRTGIGPHPPHCYSAWKLTPLGGGPARKFDPLQTGLCSTRFNSERGIGDAGRGDYRADPAKHLLKGKSIKEIARTLKISRNTVRKVLRSGET